MGQHRLTDEHHLTDQHCGNDGHRLDGGRPDAPDALARAVAEMTAQTRRLNLANDALTSRIDVIDGLRADLVERAGRAPVPV